MQNPIVKYILNNHILTTVLLVGLGIILFQVKNILLAIFLAFIIMAALNPIVEFLRKYKFPKVIAILTIYGVLIAFITLLIIPFIPVLISQIQELATSIPLYVKETSQLLGIEINYNQITSNIAPITNYLGENALTFTRGFFGGIFTLITTFILSLYLLIYHEKFQKSFPELFPKEFQQRASVALKQIEEKLGAWLTGQIFLSLTIGIITWIVLTILQVPFALPLAILAGFLEIIPTIGPIIASIPAIIVGLAISPIMGLIVTVAYILIQFSENHFFVPKIMQKAVGLNPVIVIVGILIGGHLLGVLGALLSIPFISAAIIIVRLFK